MTATACPSVGWTRTETSRTRLATNPVYELVQRETGLWVILQRTGRTANVVETGHVDRALAALDLTCYAKSRTLSPIGQGWLKVADRLASNMKFSRYSRRTRGAAASNDILKRQDILTLLMEQDYRCPVSGSYFTHDAFDAGRSPFQPSVDRIEGSVGYDRGNVRIVCLLVNLAMAEWGEEPLLKIAERISKRVLTPGLRPDCPGQQVVENKRLRLTSCEALAFRDENA